MSMTKEEMNREIAKARGWTVQFNEHKDLHELLTPQGKWEDPYDADGDETHCWNYAPDYLNNLNLCREMENALTDEQQGEYAYQLKEICCPITGEDWMAIHATPEQKCEAFCRVLFPERWRE